LEVAEAVGLALQDFHFGVEAFGNSIVPGEALISFTCRAFGHDHFMPEAFQQPASTASAFRLQMAIRVRRMDPNTCVIPFLVVVAVPSLRTSPQLFKTQYRLVLSPRSMPIVSAPVSPICGFRFPVFNALLSSFMPVSFAPFAYVDSLAKKMLTCIPEPTARR
jgi:hypothetical protein